MEKEFLPDTELQEQELELDEEQGMFEHFRLTVDQGQSPVRIDKYMVSHMEDTSRHRVQMAAPGRPDTFHNAVPPART